MREGAAGNAASGCAEQHGGVLTARAQAEPNQAAGHAGQDPARSAAADCSAVSVCETSARFIVVYPVYIID